MGRLRDLATGYQWEKIPNDVRIVMLEEDARIEALEARIAKADALAASLEAYNRGGAGPLTGWLDVEEALAAYREGPDT